MICKTIKQQYILILKIIKILLEYFRLNRGQIAPQGRYVNNRRWNERSEWNRRIMHLLYPALQGLNYSLKLSSAPAGAGSVGCAYPPVPLRSTDGFPCDGAPFQILARHAIFIPLHEEDGTR